MGGNDRARRPLGGRPQHGIRSVSRILDESLVYQKTINLKASPNAHCDNHSTAPRSSIAQQVDEPREQPELRRCVGTIREANRVCHHAQTTTAGPKRAAHETVGELQCQRSSVGREAHLR